MFKKVAIGTLVAFGLMFLLVIALATAGLAVAGNIIGAVADDIVIETAEGLEGANFEIRVPEVSIVGDDGEVNVEAPGVTIQGRDGEVTVQLPEVVVQDAEGNVARFGPEERTQRIVVPDVPRVRIDSNHSWNGGLFSPFFFVGRLMLNLAFLAMIVVGVWILVRRRTPAEKEPDLV